MPTEEEKASFEEFMSRLVHVGDPIIRKTCEPVVDFEEAKLDTELLTTALRIIRGAGLAANQIGIDQRLAVAEVRKTDLFPDRPESGLVILINPEIIAYGEESNEDYEGCFSVPGYLGLVRRPTSVTVRCQTFDQESKEITFEGYLARVVQHEIDHLNGTVYIDRMESMRDFTTRPNFQAFILKR